MIIDCSACTKVSTVCYYLREEFPWLNMVQRLSVHLTFLLSAKLSQVIEASNNNTDSQGSHDRSYLHKVPSLINAITACFKIPAHM
jgi:hypothetical protein